ncbi:MarR family winged helix-turn-helix transcriptional regulator [Occultella gossypii]|uniref:MarR family transcriptional regulator n=1 Tax=Occultella gossypii TaxID=2800820 RepID=A0ABS7S470_9MICO|nr:MarR family transcriptional regulator [Occultella gossypii]MBZ2195110.1 MarR family transcriptional regulator [Occultella gossypii]
MTSNLPKRQSAVNDPEWPARTSEGEAFTSLVVSVAALGDRITRAGEDLAALGGLSLARWVVLDAACTSPATVAQLARARGMARQSVQRVADALVADELATFEENPQHRRAKLLVATPAGRAAVLTINAAQKAWADAVGGALGATAMTDANRAVGLLREALDAGPDVVRPGDPRDP